MRDIVVKVEGLKKYYQVGTNVVKALDGVDLEIENREFISIIGQSGSGKSTLLNMLGGLDYPSEGRLTVAEMDLFQMDREQLAIFRRRKIGFIFQQYNLIPDLNVYDNVIFPLEIDGGRIEEDFIVDLLKKLHIEDKKNVFPNMLSGGEQQRVAIARALATRPAIILADEPTGNLDTNNSHEVIGLLMTMAKQYQQTLIIITHNLDIAQLADRIIQLKDGKIVKERGIHAIK